MMLSWRIYYGDGSTFDNKQGDPSRCSNINVQAIVVKDDINGNSIWYGFDFYLYNRAGGWIGVKDVAALLDHLLNAFDELAVVKQGRTIGDELWRTIFHRAMHDQDFPSTSRAKKFPRS